MPRKKKPLSREAQGLYNRITGPRPYRPKIKIQKSPLRKLTSEEAEDIRFLKQQRRRRIV